MREYDSIEKSFYFEDRLIILRFDIIEDIAEVDFYFWDKDLEEEDFERASWKNPTKVLSTLLTEIIDFCSKENLIIEFMGIDDTLHSFYKRALKRKGISYSLKNKSGYEKIIINPMD